jgi:hypothetical protein
MILTIRFGMNQPSKTHIPGGPPRHPQREAGAAARLRPVKPGYYLMRLRLRYTQKEARPLAKILSRNRNNSAPPS